jgi:hypothetical protein
MTVDGDQAVCLRTDGKNARSTCTHIFTAARSQLIAQTHAVSLSRHAQEHWVNSEQRISEARFRQA